MLNHTLFAPILSSFAPTLLPTLYTIDPTVLLIAPTIHIVINWSIMLRKQTQRINTTTHNTGTDGDLSHSFIWLINGKQEKNIANNATPDTVAEDDFSTHTGN
jgi:hypothetical protein